MWIERAYRTDPIEPDKIVPAIEGLYHAAGLKRPRVVIAPSPLVMAFAYGAAATIWWQRKHGKKGVTDRVADRRTKSAVDQVYCDAHDATDRAMDQNTHLDALLVTYGAVESATRNAVLNAVSRGTDAALNRNVDDAPKQVVDTNTDYAIFDRTYGAAATATECAAGNKIYRSVSRITHGAVGRAAHDVVYYATRDAVLDVARNVEDAVKQAVNRDADSATGTIYHTVLAAAECAAGSEAYHLVSTATHDVVDDAARDAINATLDAVNNATRGSINAALDAVFGATTPNAVSAAIIGAASACYDLAGPLGIACAKRWNAAYQGGNTWAPYECLITAMRDVLGLRLPEHEAYRYWEEAAIHGGFRVMHSEFCIVCDFPEVIRVDDQRRPHCTDGPSHRWRDGWSLYHWHGVPVPRHWIEQRDTLDPAEVLQAKNVEQRAAGAAIVGWPKMIDRLERRIIDGDPDSDMGALIELTLPGLRHPGRFLQARCPRNGIIVEGVPRISDIDGLPIDTVIAAQAWRVGDPQSEYIHPPRRT
jgi:hypothetical protein